MICLAMSGWLAALLACRLLTQSPLIHNVPVIVVTLSVSLEQNDAIREHLQQLLTLIAVNCTLSVRGFALLT